jgi:HK97 gp10 family phage protein
MKVTLRFEGGQQLAAALKGLPSRVSKRMLLEALRQAAEPLRDRMEQNAPVGPDAPHLRDMVVVGPSRGQDAREAAVAVGATRAGFYGSFQEFGTAHHAAQPWARPAFDATYQQVLRALADEIWIELSARGIRRPSGGDGFDGVAVEGEV